MEDQQDFNLHFAEEPIPEEEQQDYLWSVHEIGTNDPLNFVGLYEAPTYKDAIDLAVAESIRVDPRFPRVASELRAVLAGKERDGRGVWLPLKSEENEGETDYSDERTVERTYDPFRYE